MFLLYRFLFPHLSDKFYEVSISASFLQLLGFYELGMDEVTAPAFLAMEQLEWPVE